LFSGVYVGIEATTVYDDDGDDKILNTQNHIILMIPMHDAYDNVCVPMVMMMMTMMLITMSMHTMNIAHHESNSMNKQPHNQPQNTNMHA